MRKMGKCQTLSVKCPTLKNLQWLHRLVEFSKVKETTLKCHTKLTEDSVVVDDAMFIEHYKNKTKKIN